ncbi:MAG: DUF2752 domain-containing protein [Bacteroidia bacterium]|nr:DUF2752 domain-containing protein [Bacteroidia bacterium]
MFGVDCPGCGMQRAFIALLRGDLLASLKYNASLIPFLITIFYTIGHLIFSFKNGAKCIVLLFSVTVSVLVVNFVIKLILHS